MRTTNRARDRDAEPRHKYRPQTRESGTGTRQVRGIRGRTRDGRRQCKTELAKRSLVRITGEANCQAAPAEVRHGRSGRNFAQPFNRAVTQGQPQLVEDGNLRARYPGQNHPCIPRSDLPGAQGTISLLLF